MIFSAAQLAASAVVLALAGSSGRNMLQTSRIANNNKENNGLLSSVTIDDGIASDDDSDLVFSSTKQQNTVRYLQSLKRKELLELFCSSSVSDTTSLNDIKGEWNGILLENNGLLMTKVSGILTHGLFGMGRTWNGKAFALDSQQQENAVVDGITKTTTKQGVNRFFGRSDRTSTEFEHSFDFSIASSKIVPNEQSIQLRYSKYQSPFSLWKTMVDEVRIIPGNDDVLIGFGSMAWSGGMLNSAPFCLWRVKK